MRYSNDRRARLTTERNTREQRGAGKLREPKSVRWVLAGFADLMGLGRALGNAARREFGLTTSLLAQAQSDWLCDVNRWADAQASIPADEQDTVMPDYLLDREAELDCLRERFGLDDAECINGRPWL